MERETIIIHRDELYKQVWKEPMIHLAPKYCLSDVGLRKICNKLGVPTPPVGYWVKISHGYKIPITPLPKLKFGEPDTYNLQPRRIDSDAEKILEDDSYIPEEIKSAKKIIVPKYLRDPHPWIREMQNALENAEIDKYGLVYSRNNHHFDIRVSPKNLKRALRILDTLAKWFENMDLHFKTENYDRPVTYIELFSEKLKFVIKEKTNQIDHVLTKKEIEDQRRYSYSMAPRYDYIPTGKLSLIIDVWGASGTRKIWSDSKSGLIEDMLNDFVVGLLKAAYLLRQRRLEREEEKRRWEEEQERLAEEARQREIERQLLLDLENQAELWAKSKQLRAYIQEVENKAKHQSTYKNFNERLNKWLSWAKEHADRLDPLQKKLSFEDDLIDAEVVKN